MTRYILLETQLGISIKIQNIICPLRTSIALSGVYCVKTNVSSSWRHYVCFSIVCSGQELVKRELPVYREMAEKIMIQPHHKILCNHKKWSHTRLLGANHSIPQGNVWVTNLRCRKVYIKKNDTRKASPVCICVHGNLPYVCIHIGYMIMKKLKKDAPKF